MRAHTREFELAVKSFSADLYRFAFWLARDRHVAEDLLQQCFERAWINWESLNDQVAVKKWLFTILRREFLRRLERKQLDIIDIDGLESPAADTLSMDELYGLRQALARAPDSLREPLLMQVLGGFSAEELAVLNQTSAGAMVTRLSRARQWLRNRLSSDGAPPAAPATLGKIKE